MSQHRMKPSEIRFSQDSIRSTFGRGDNVHSVVDRIIKAGYIGNNEFFLPLTVFYHRIKQEWFAKNNRSLYVCRVLEHEGIIRDVPVNEVSVESIRQGKVTTKNMGVSVNIRGGVPRPHSIQGIQHQEALRNGTCSFGNLVSMSHSYGDGRQSPDDDHRHFAQFERRQVQQQTQATSNESGPGWGTALALGAVAVAGMIGAAAGNQPEETRKESERRQRNQQGGDGECRIQ